MPFGKWFIQEGTWINSMEPEAHTCAQPVGCIPPFFCIITTSQGWSVRRKNVWFPTIKLLTEMNRGLAFSQWDLDAEDHSSF